MQIKTMRLSSKTSLSYVGPDLDAGPLPAVFYFALSANESLELDPYNQPVAFLSKHPMRIFSLTLPGHGQGLPAKEALNFWADEVAAGRNFVEEFVEEVRLAIQELTKNGMIDSAKLGVAGLSRGGFMAAHIAAKISAFGPVLGFAPLTTLTYARWFDALKENPLANSLNLVHQIPALIGHPLRFYIGNRDHMVSTSLCFQCVQELTEVSYQAGIRSPQVELVITPSIGHQGHGTAKQIFIAGAQWMLQQLGVVHG